MQADRLSPTDRLYWQDPYLQHFTSRVVASREAAGQTWVALAKSAFYPEGGGQPGDHGTLNDVPVLDTQEHDNIVWHLLAAPLTGTDVEGKVAWQRRFDFMQQHHGQHLLSAGFDLVVNAPTVSVHLGASTATVDLRHATLGETEMAAVEDWTNQVIYQNLPVHARFVSATELAGLALRKQPVVDGPIRIVSAGNIDHSPCGGTHPHRTGEVGIVALRRWERRGDQTRVEFVCGQRAVHDYRSKSRLVQRLAGDLSVALDDLPATVSRIRGAEDASRKALEQNRIELARYQAQALVAKAPLTYGVPIIVTVLRDRGFDELRHLGREIAAAGGIALLALATDKAQFIFTRPAGSKADMATLLREAAALVGGKGGGKPDAAQGGGPQVANIDVALATVHEQLLSKLTDHS
ncbi:MAG: DHHA1 domain-containing protein [Herpetosiphon sp.]